jgi:hypothetical protein
MTYMAINFLAPGVKCGWDLVMDLGSRAASSLSEVSGVSPGVVVFDRSRPLLYV